MLLEKRCQAAVRCCLRRVAMWKPPPNWSHRQWMEEMGAEAEAGAWSVCQEEDDEISFWCIYQHALNACLQRYRQEWRYAWHCSPSLDVMAYAEADGADLRAALDSLSEEEKQLLRQLFWERCTETELAQQQGVSVQAVSKRKQAVLKKLRRMMR